MLLVRIYISALFGAVKMSYNGVAVCVGDYIYIRGYSRRSLLAVIGAACIYIYEDLYFTCRSSVLL